MNSQDKSRDAQISRAFRETRPSLRRIARKAEPSDDEDLVQDAFLKIVERSRHQEISKLDNLLRHVVRCVTIDRFRLRARRPKAISLDVGEVAVDAAADPERSLMGTQRLQRVLSAIEAMPPKRREAFMLHRVEELTYAQIAKRMNVSIKTVEKHLHLAMRQLSDTDD